MNQFSSISASNPNLCTIGEIQIGIFDFYESI